MSKRMGRLIVIDGSDGVGKATQTKLLMERLAKEGIKAKTLDFPQYEFNFFGKLIGECLAGEHGDFIALSPHIASVLYAADRFESKEKIIKWLKDGYTVVLDRYVSANQMHQGSKIPDAKKRRAFLEWLDQLEHGVFGLPRPDLILYLHLPLPIALELLRQKHLVAKKTYLKKGKKDLAESNPRHLLDAQEGALKLIRSGASWKKITCAARGNILPREHIHELIFTEVTKVLKR